MSRLRALPYPGEGLFCSIDANLTLGYTKLYTFKNNTSYPSSNVVDIYNATLNTWSAATLSQHRGGLTAIAADGKIFFAGGGDIFHKL